MASEEDVASAPGLFRINLQDEVLVAVAEGGTETVVISGDTRCLVCLCDFEVDEEARRLVKCGHLFHRPCIDQVSYTTFTSQGANTYVEQWLTTGRNSCPLCRAQGVDEKQPSSLQMTNPDPNPDVANNSAQSVA